jgi:iron-sulfur cluster repair protein YtfE (RIC family)
MPTLTECLQRDHRRLDAILTESKAHAAAGRFSDAADRFTTFLQGLERHIDAEEDVLFPALSEQAPQMGGPMGVMRAEHIEIRDLMATLAIALATSDPTWRSTVCALEEVLSGHNIKEERVLYPTADEALGGAPDVDALSAKLSGRVGAH